MSQSLFRKEVFEAKRTGWLGAISLAQPVSFWAVTVFAVIAASLIVFFLVFGSYTRKTPVSGQLVPVQGLSVVVAPAAGVVTRLHVEEGEQVQAGQPLVTLQMPRSIDDARDAHAATAAQLESRKQRSEQARQAQSDLLEARRVGLSAQMAATRSELEQMLLEVATRQEQVALARQTLERLQALREEKFVSELQLKQQQALVLDYTSEVQLLQRQVISSQRLVSQLQQSLAELPAQDNAVQADYGKEVALLELEKIESEARKQVVVTAATAGVVSTQNFKAGQSVQAGQVLSHILPGDGALEASLLVPSSAIGFVSVGDPVQLRYQAFPYQKFGHQRGVVDSVSRSYVAAEGGNSLYRVSVKLKSQSVVAYGVEEGLLPGMLLDADVLGERRRLIEWILEPVLSLK